MFLPSDGNPSALQAQARDGMVWYGMTGRYGDWMGKIKKDVLKHLYCVLLLFISQVQPEEEHSRAVTLGANFPNHISEVTTMTFVEVFGRLRSFHPIL